MKRITTFLFLVTVLIFSSCAAQRKMSEHVRVYKREMVGDVGPGPSYLILKGSRNYELYWPWSDKSYFGEFNLQNDTLCLQPPGYSYAKSSIEVVENSGISFSTIPVYFVQQKGKLKDITDYRNYPELAPFVTEPGGVFDGFVRIR